jgi:cbb3-type cytochrome oxidase maturation protein
MIASDVMTRKVMSIDPDSAAFCGIASFARANGEEAGVSHIYFSYAGRTCSFAISQRLRPDAIETVQALRNLGFDLRILSGDRAAAVRPAAEALGLGLLGLFGFLWALKSGQYNDVDGAALRVLSDDDLPKK